MCLRRLYDTIGSQPRQPESNKMVFFSFAVDTNTPIGKMATSQASFSDLPNEMRE
jgi:hypothetical protein